MIFIVGQRETGSALVYLAFFLAYGAEDEVGVLFRHEFQLGLCSVQEAFASKTTRSYGYLALVNVVAGTGQVVIQT